MIVGETPPLLDDNMNDYSSRKMSSDVSASLPSFHQPYKLRHGGTTEIPRHRHHGENPSTSHEVTTSYKNPLYRDTRGGDEALNGVEGAASSSIVSPQYPAPRGRGESAQRWSFGRARRSVPPVAEMDMSGMILLPDPKRTSSNFTRTKDGGEGRSKRRRGDSTRAPGSSSSNNRLGVGGGREDRASSNSLTGGKEPPIQGYGCLTTATFLKMVTILGALCSAVLVWLQYDPATGGLCAKGKNKPCLDKPVSMALLTIAKMCAGALFPSIIVSMLSKCYATRHFLNNSWLSLVVDIEPTHKLHTFYGEVTMICSVVHSLAHIARLAYENEAEQLHMSAMNRSGLAAFVLLLLAALPMVMGSLKSKWTFELRKLMHLAFIPFIIAMCFHGNILRLLGAILLTWYLVDRFYFTTRMTFLIDRPNFKIVGRGTLVRFNLPDGYHFKPGAYVQVNCPAIGASEWHPFSLFPVPGSRPRAGFHIEAVGDWTQELFRLSLENPHMPLWITAAQPSVLEQTVYYDNVILVCTGAGITPGVGLIERFASRKNIHLMWLSREAGMVAMFEKQVRLVKSTINLTGRPSAKTKQRLVDLLAPSRSEVVATTAASSRSRSGSHTAAPSSSDLSALEAADRRAVSLRDYPGALRDEGDHHGDGEKEKRDSESDGRWGEEERSSRFGAGTSPVEESPTSRRDALRKSSRGSGGGDAEHAEEKRLRDRVRDQSPGRGRRSQSESKHRAKREGDRQGFSRGRSHSRSHNRSHSRSRTRSRSRSRSPSRSHSRSHSRGHSLNHSHSFNGGGKRSRGLHPVSVCFGRPDIERYIAETVQGTAVTAEWADQAVGPAGRKSPSPSRLRQALVRLNTNQRISKMDLMSADLSVVAKKASSVSNIPDGIGASGTVAIGQNERQTDDNSKWLVLYCGANVAVEKALATACAELKITWRKEYFSAW